MAPRWGQVSDGLACTSKARRGVLCDQELEEQEESSAKERAQLGVGLLRSPLGKVVAAVEHPTEHLLGPPAPDVQTS